MIDEYQNITVKLLVAASISRGSSGCCLLDCPDIRAVTIHHKNEEFITMSILIIDCTIFYTHLHYQCNLGRALCVPQATAILLYDISSQ